jgi:polyphenol oxidase
MFHRKRSGIYVSSLFSDESWLEHGFASRTADGWPGPYGRVAQIHSATVHLSNDLDGAPAGDAVVTDRPGHWIGVRTADCVPLLLADTRHRAVAAVHAGWRGTLANIVGATLEKLRETYGTDPSDVIAAVGPCIGECCFEVGPEVAEQFQPLLRFESLPSHIDLVEANLRHLVAGGVPPERIDVSELCTMCDEAEFHSYRRDRDASGRMVSAIQVKNEKR